MRHAARLAFFLVLLTSASRADAATLSGVIKAGSGIEPLAPLPVAVDDWTCGEGGFTPDPRLVLGAERGLADVVVTVLDFEPPVVEDAEALEQVVLDQRDCVFTPHVVVVQPGQELLVRNSDSVLHTFRTITKHNRVFNRAQVKGKEDVFKFTKPETIRVECDVHYWMGARVVVAPHAFVAVTDAGGAFKIGGLEPARYRLRLWQERLGEKTVTVDVGAEGGRVDVVWDARTSAAAPDQRAGGDAAQ